MIAHCAKSQPLENGYRPLSRHPPGTFRAASRGAKEDEQADPIFSTWRRRVSLLTQGFGYAVMNLGLGSGGSMIHIETMQGFRPSGVTSEQLTSNF